MPRVNSIIHRAVLYRAVFGIAAGAALLALPLSPAQADDWEDCRSNIPAKAEAGCGALIERGA